MQNCVFLYSLNNFLLENAIIFFLFWKLNFKMALIWKKRGYFWHTFHIFLSHQRKVPNSQKIRQHIFHLHTYTYFAHPIDFFNLPIFSKLRIYHGVSLWCDSWCWFFPAPFWSNQLITKWWAKFRLECLILIFIYTNAKFIVICKPRTLNDCRWRLSSKQKRKKMLLSSSHFVCLFVCFSVKLLQLNGLPESFGSSFTRCNIVYA